jgi:hypothetical protein
VRRSADSHPVSLRSAHAPARGGGRAPDAAVSDRPWSDRCRGQVLVRSSWMMGSVDDRPFRPCRALAAHRLTKSRPRSSRTTRSTVTPVGRVAARPRTSGSKQPEQLIRKLRKRPDGRAGDQRIKARRAVALAIDPLVVKLSELTSQFGHCLRVTRTITSSLFNGGSVSTAADLGRDRLLPRSLPHRRCVGCRRRHEPGRDRVGRTQSRCAPLRLRQRLRDAFGVLADTVRRWHPLCRRSIRSRDERRHDHPRAIRTLGPDWCRVLWRCWQDHAGYDPAQHRGLQQHVLVTMRPSVPAPESTAVPPRLAGGPWAPAHPHRSQTPNSGLYRTATSLLTPPLAGSH